MNKKYIFNEKTISNLNDLGLAYSTNFQLAIIDVEQNQKKLLKYVKCQRKSIYKEVLNIFEQSKNKSSIVTILIHMFTYDNIVCINGNVLTFEQFVEGYLENKESYRSFIEDYGLEKTFGSDPKHPNLKNNASVIRRHINDEFVDTYVSNYFKYDGLEDLTPYLTFTREDELFYKYNETFKGLELQLILSQKCGLEHALKLRNEDYPVFYGLKLINEYFTEEEIIDILNKSHNIWLLANINKYTYKSKAKETLKKLKDVTNLYKKALKSNDVIKIIDTAYMVCEIYLEFVNNFNKKLILVNKKESNELYDLNIKYCDTYVAKCYIDDLQIEDVFERKSETTINNETSIIETKKYNSDDFNAKKEKKRINKLNRYKNGLVFFDILAILYLLGVIITSFLELEMFIIPLSDSTLDLVFIGLLVVILIFSSIISFRINRITKSYNRVVRLRNLYTTDIEIDNKDEEIEMLENKDKKNLKKASSSIRITTSLTCAMLAFIYGVIIISVINSLLLDTVNQYIDWSSSYDPNSSAISFLMFGPLLAFLFGLLKKKKGFFTNVLVIILAVVGVILPVFIF